LLPKVNSILIHIIFALVIFEVMRADSIHNPYPRLAVVGFASTIFNGLCDTVALVKAVRELRRGSEDEREEGS
jgi:hypothetical protein